MTLSAVEKTCAHKDNDIVIHDEVSGVKKVFLSGGSVLRMAKSGYQLNSILLAFMTSFFNNRMVGATLAPEAFKVRSNMGIKFIRVVQGHPEGVST